ncbi:hypothetical protein MRX96_054202 [Rhipicephalus microplus]
MSDPIEKYFGASLPGNPSPCASGVTSCRTVRVCARRVERVAAMGRHKKVRTPEEEAAFREARLAAMRERQRQADPEYAARALENKRRRRSRLC